MNRLAEDMAQFAVALKSAVGEGASARWEQTGLASSELDEDDPAELYARTIPIAFVVQERLRQSVHTVGQYHLGLERCHPIVGELLRAALGGEDDVGHLCRTFSATLGAWDLDAVLGDDGTPGLFELFLRKFDGRCRRENGVYYTPRALAAFMVRGVDQHLRDHFGLSDGLGARVTRETMRERSPSLALGPLGNEQGAFVRILDPCTGCGTFLLEVMRLIWSRWRNRSSEAWSEFVFDHLLPNLEGRELMLSAALVCELQLVLFLVRTGLDPQACYEALQVSRGNTLLDDALITDGFSVVLGNPPYSGLSQNMSPRLRAEVQPYLYVDGERLAEEHGCKMTT